MEFITNTVVSKDRTKIGYRQIGAGPALIIYHGGGRISQNYELLAKALSDQFTVIIPDRRGRGLSGTEGPDYGIEKAKEDLLAVVEFTKADLVFGHSAGALITLETAVNHSFKKIAVYDPPISVDGSLPLDWFPSFEKAIAQRKMKRAIAILIKGLQLADGLSSMPLWMILCFVNILALFALGKKEGEGMIALVPTISADMRMIIGLKSGIEHYNAIQSPVLLLLGAKSPGFFLKGLKGLESVLKECSMDVLPGLDHSAPEEKVEEIAEKLKLFFADTI